MCGRLDDYAEKEAVYMARTRQHSSLGGSLISSQIVSRLVEELRCGCYANATRLPPETELAAAMRCV